MTVSLYTERKPPLKTAKKKKKINTQFQSHCAFLQLSTCRHVQYLQFRKFIQIIPCLLSGTSALSEFSMTREMRLFNLYYATTSFFLTPRILMACPPRFQTFTFFSFFFTEQKQQENQVV